MALGSLRGSTILKELRLTLLTTLRTLLITSTAAFVHFTFPATSPLRPWPGVVLGTQTVSVHWHSFTIRGASRTTPAVCCTLLIATTTTQSLTTLVTFEKSSFQLPTSITLVSRDYYYYLCVNGNGSLFYATTFNNVLLVNVSSGKITVLAGLFGAPGIIDGPGQSARFNYLQGIALNSDETALILADQNNQRIRKLDLATNNVTTIAGSATKGAIDGPGLSSTFNYPVGAKWHCDVTSALCGLLVADLLNNALRFVAIEGPTNTATFSAQSTRSTELTRTESTSGATSLSRSSTISLSRSLSRYSRTWSRSEVDTSSLTATSLPTQSSSQSDSNDRSNSNSLSASSTSTSVLSSSNSATSTSSRSITRHSPSASAIISLSSSVSLSGSLNHSISRHTPSASTTIYCALVPADGSTSVGSLQSFNATSATSVTEVIPLTPPAAAAVSNSSVAISRTTLLQNLPFGVNLSLSLGGTVLGGPVDGWELVSALVQAFPIDALFPLVVATAPTTLLSTAVAGRTQTLTVLLDPPLTFGTNPSSPRWLPTSLSTFRSVTLVLKLSLRCPTDHSIEVPCPGHLQPLASEVKSASFVALYATSLAGAAGSGAVGRLGAVRNLVLCSGSTSVEGMLPLVVDACDDEGESSNARGSIVGNLILWAMGCLLMITAVAVYAHLSRTSLRSATEALGAPSLLLPLVVVTVPSTASGVFSLLLLTTPVCTANVVLMIIGFVMCVCPIAVLAVVSYMIPRRLTLVNIHVNSDARAVNSVVDAGAWWGRLHSTIKILFHRRLKWRGTVVEHNDQRAVDTTTERSTTGGVNWRRVATVMLLDYAVVWYCCVDVGVLTVASVIGAISSAQASASACRASAIAVLILYVAQLILCAWLRPFTTVFSRVYALFTLALSAVAVGCQMGYMFGSAANAPVNLDVLSQLLVVAAVCDLAVSSASTLRTAMDLFEVLKACGRHAHFLWIQQAHHKPRGDVPLNEIAEMLEFSNCDMDEENIQVEDDEVELSEFDDVFWNKDGSAAVLSADHQSSTTDEIGISTAAEVLGLVNEQEW